MILTKGFDAIKHATVTKFKNVGSLNIQSRCFSSFLFYAKYYVISPTQKFEIWLEDHHQKALLIKIIVLLMLYCKSFQKIDLINTTLRCQLNE